MEDTVHVECLQASLHVTYNFLSIQCHKEYSEACSKLAKLQSSGAEAAKVLCDFEICCLVLFSFSTCCSKTDWMLILLSDSFFQQEHVQTLCRNTHNAYVLQLNSVNNMNRVFYSSTLPQMLNVSTFNFCRSKQILTSV